MSRPEVLFKPIWPWTPARRAAVGAIIEDMAPADAEEIFGLHDLGFTPEDLTAAIGGLMGTGAFLEGFVAFEARGEDPVPVAAALAWRQPMPRVASLGMFGRAGYARAMPAVYAELGRRWPLFGARHGVVLAQVPVMTAHRAAMRRLRALGGIPAFDYGPVGRHGQPYTHMIWRFPDGFSQPQAES